MKLAVARVWTLLAGLGAAFFPIFCFALGLGDLQIDSRLNEPLRARVEIVDVSEDDWRQIHATLAPQLAPEDSVHPEVLDTITLRPIEDAQNRHFVEVKSDKS